jgi:hypothetical protein
VPTVSEALKSFLSARKTDANADLIARWSMAMETQVLVGVRDGEPVAGKRSTYSNGSDTWHAIRVPHDAGTVPNWEDYELRYPFDTYADGIGMTGLDWQALCSRWVAYDFDALTGHAKGIGVSEDDLERVKSAAQRLPYVEVRKSTRGSGVHLYVYLDAIPCENHTVHAALARCILGMMSAEVGFDFASQIDACGGNMWVWHRKMTAENGGLSVIKKATKVLTAVDLPANWRDHIAVITKQRKKVRVNEVSDDKLDAFEVLASSQTIVALDDRHKAIIEALQQSSYTTLWIADHHLLQAHTCALKRLMEEPVKTELALVGEFDTNSEGRNPGSPNAFLFPLPNGAWRVFRFSPGVVEAPTWEQDGAGWTSCYFNRRPTLEATAKAHGGIEDPDKTGFVFSNPDDAMTVAKVLGQRDTPIDALFTGRKTTLKPHKDGRLIVEIERTKEDANKPEPKGWLAKKTKWVRVFKTVINNRPEDDEIESTEFDNVLRALKSPAKQFVGWVVFEGKEWVSNPAANVKMLLQNLGKPKDKAESIMGGAIGHSWKLVSLPFREQYPGDRQWNLDAPQFKYQPADLGPNEVPVHPHWDKIFDHLGIELTPALKGLDWAEKANIKTGADYLRAWVACAFRDPFEPTPYLFLYGNQECGKSILHEALSVLVTKGVVKAAKALSAHNEFNKELNGAIICAVEEKDLSQSPEALARIKEWVTAKTLSIRQMRTDVYEVPNTTHWIQTANAQSHCPVFPGDTRITVIEVCDLLEEQKIAKQIMLAKLKEEAPHFMYTLMNLQLPPVIGRMRLPVVKTASKERLTQKNAPVAPFVAEMCEIRDTEDCYEGTVRLYAAYVVWAQGHKFTALSECRFKEELFRVTDNQVRDNGRRLIVGCRRARVYDGICLKEVSQ